MLGLYGPSVSNEPFSVELIDSGYAVITYKNQAGFIDVGRTVPRERCGLFRSDSLGLLSSLVEDLCSSESMIAFNLVGTELFGRSDDKGDSVNPLTAWDIHQIVPESRIGKTAELLDAELLDRIYKSNALVEVVWAGAGMDDEIVHRVGAGLKARFQALAQQWRDETGAYSFDGQKGQHSAYKQILDLGDSVVPLILQELVERPYRWFTALETLTGENPVKPEDQGHFSKTVDSWIDWGKRKGYIGP